MFRELCATPSRILLADLASGGPFSALWQILAILAVVGIVIVVVLAIIEPGPLVKRRPFSREERSRVSESEGDGRNSMDTHSATASADRSLDQNEGS